MVPQNSGHTVLLVEDVAVNRRVAAAFLAKQGHHVVEAVSGQDALSAVEYQDFSLILLDIRLPDMDGVDVAAHIRSHKDCAKAEVPILALTANVFPDDIKRYRAVGMNGVVAKPIQLDQFRMTVAAILDPQAGGDQGTSASANVADCEESPFACGQVLDTAFIAERLATLGTDTFIAILRIGERSVSEALEGVEKAVQGGSAGTLAKAAHRLAGAASNFGYAGLFTLARRLEEQADSANPESQTAAFSAAQAVGPLAQETRRALTAWLDQQGLALQS
jgi:CheY-like chemotaxis protein